MSIEGSRLGAKFCTDIEGCRFVGGIATGGSFLHKCFPDYSLLPGS